MPESRKRLGRPLGSGGGPRFPHRITVPLSDAQYAELVARSEETGETAAEIIRAALTASDRTNEKE